MVVDTSAVMAILKQEPDARSYAELIETANVRLISAVSMLEAGILALSRKGDEGAQELDAFLRPSWKWFRLTASKLPSAGTLSAGSARADTPPI